MIQGIHGTHQHKGLLSRIDSSLGNNLQPKTIDTPFSKKIDQHQTSGGMSSTTVDPQIGEGGPSLLNQQAHSSTVANVSLVLHGKHHPFPQTSTQFTRNKFDSSLQVTATLRAHETVPSASKQVKIGIRRPLTEEIQHIHTADDYFRIVLEACGPGNGTAQ